MPIAAAVTGTATAPVHAPVHVAPRHISPGPQPRTAPRREQSPLNPSSSHSQALRSGSCNGGGASSAATDGARAHIANLDRVLGKPPPVPRPPSHAGAAPCKGEQQGEQEPLNIRHGLLNALNLSFFVPMPGMRARTAADEHMSPRSLMHMQQLLSADSPRASPRCTIAPKWRRLHGEGGWAGLLDPLDSDLRRELLRYGDFVQAAYQAFHSLPTASARHRGLMLPDRSYRPTRSLFATSALSMPPWAKRPNTPEWLTQQSNWIGYVAVCESDREVTRMGRRDIAIVLRGTATCLEWAENLRASLVPLDGESSDGKDGGAEDPKVARGFRSLYKTAGEKVNSLSQDVMDEVRRLMEKYKGEELSITIVGHSLGGALALLVADEIATSVPDAPPVAVVSFGGPKVGNGAFVEKLKKSGKVNVLRIVNAGDMVTKVPGVAPRLPLTKEQYQHVGAELRIDSKNSPCLRPDAGPASRHDLEAYLHLIDGFTATGHPFRYDARRSVIRLLQLQKGNVKKEYVNRARELGVDPAAPADVGRSMAFNCAGAELRIDSKNSPCLRPDAWPASRSYCSSSSSDLCEDDDDAAASPSRGPLPFDLNMPPPQEAAEDAARAAAAGNFFGPTARTWSSAAPTETADEEEDCYALADCRLSKRYMEYDMLEHILDGSEKPTNLPFALLKDITEHFSEEREIGQGGFGTVYKGVLPNRNVAVKRIRNNHTIDEKLFYREVNSLLKVNHQNVVRFLGFCANTELTAIKVEGKREYIYAEIRERLLCFEYINNGNLQKHITDELRGLEWNIRYQVIKGICEGLCHLHMENHIIHMDLKPANILLDHRMVPKLTDFGLSRFDETSRTMTVDRFLTLGYCAPEYLYGGRMSVKSDIYSLGVIIIELVTGHKSIPDNSNVLRRWRHRWKKSAKETKLGYQQVTKCIEIGLRCQESDPYKRPFIGDVIRDIIEMEGTDGQISNTNGSTVAQISPYMEDDMLGIEPLELHFPFEPNKLISCSVQLTNETDAYIAFNIQTTSPLPYCIQPNKDIVPPRSKCSIKITLQPRENAPQHASEFIVRSTKVNDGLAAEDITTGMFNKEAGNMVDEVNLDVVF